MIPSDNELYKIILKQRFATPAMPDAMLDPLVEFELDRSENFLEAFVRLSIKFDSIRPSQSGQSVDPQNHINEINFRRIDALEKQLAELEKQLSDLKNSSPKKLVDTWQIVQAIMTVLAFSGTVLSLFKIFKS